tara:strand:- start:785 stop:1303 length:519 start_codon:yes stop_codon:yes gene_type:complete
MSENDLWSEKALKIIEGDIEPHEANIFCRPESDMETVVKGDYQTLAEKAVSVEKEKKAPDGKLRDFGTGATRSKDADGERYDLISPFALRRLAVIMAEGAGTHGPANWEKGVPLDATLNHLERHLQLWKMEQKTGKKIDHDDHMAKVIWGAMAICHYEEVGPIMRGSLTPNK